MGQLTYRRGEEHLRTQFRTGSKPRPPRGWRYAERMLAIAKGRRTRQTTTEAVATTKPTRYACLATGGRVITRSVVWARCRFERFISTVSLRAQRRVPLLADRGGGLHVPLRGPSPPSVAGWRRSIATELSGHGSAFHCVRAAGTRNEMSRPSISAASYP